jgi:hypothetical protein
MERPDPLAEPEGYGRRPGDEPDYSGSCSIQVAEGKAAGLVHAVVHSGNCGKPSVLIVTWGCTIGEHAGKLGYCADHTGYATTMPLTCGICTDREGHDVAVRVFKRERLAPGGHEPPEKLF